MSSASNTVPLWEQTRTKTPKACLLLQNSPNLLKFFKDTEIFLMVRNEKIFSLFHTILFFSPANPPNARERAHTKKKNFPFKSPVVSKGISKQVVDVLEE
jgi:hypothetical protein